MRALLDTCVLAEIRHPQGNARVKQAVQQIDEANLFLSVLTIGEIAKGVALLPAGRKKDQLSQWLGDLEAQFADRLLPVDRETASTWGEITARGQQGGQPLPVIDGLLAATALRHGLHLMTRNVRHFQATGVPIIDPWP